MHWCSTHLKSYEVLEVPAENIFSRWNFLYSGSFSCFYLQKRTKLYIFTQTHIDDIKKLKVLNCIC